MYKYVLTITEITKNNRTLNIKENIPIYSYSKTINRLLDI